MKDARYLHLNPLCRAALACLVAATVSATLTARVIVRRFGPVRVGTDVIYRTWGSPSGVRETTSDSDRDGRTDSWLVSIRDGREGGCTYISRDYDGNGTPDSWCAWFGGIFSAGYSLSDDDKDGTPDKQEVWVPDVAGSRKTLYEDLDRDGELDTMLDVATTRRCILLNAKWVPAVRREGNAPGRAYVLQKPNGSEVEVVFDDGEWKVQQ